MLSHSFSKSLNQKQNPFITVSQKLPESKSVIITEDYEPTENDNIILINGKCVINLPDIDNKVFVIKDITGKKNIAKIQCNGKIDDGDYLMVGEFESYSLICKIIDSSGESKTNYFIL